MSASIKIKESFSYVMLKKDIFIYHADKESFSLYSLTNKNVYKKIAFDKGFQFISSDNDCISFFDNSGVGYKIIINSGEIEYLALHNEMSFSNVNCENLYSVYWSKSIFDASQGGIYDLSINEVLWKRDNVQLFYICKKFSVGYREFNVVLYSTLNGDTLWQFDLSTLRPYQDEYGDSHPTELVSVVGVYEEKLWVYIKGKRLLCLDVENGSLVKILDLSNSVGLSDDIASKSSLSPNIYGLGIHLDSQKGLIKILASRYYLEIDLKLMLSEVKADFGTEPDSWRIHRSCFYEGDKNLYFIGKRGIAFDTAVGIFDTEQYTVIWSDEPLEKDNYLFFADVPQCNKTHLAVIDTNNNLYLYKKSEII